MPVYNSPRQFEIAPQGTFVGWLEMFVDVGHQMVRSEKYGDKPKRQAQLRFVLPTKLMSDGRPFSISMKITLSNMPAAIYRKMIPDWVGRSMTDDEFAAFDERELFNVPCMLTIQHMVGRDGDRYANISNVSAIPEGYEAPLPGGETIYVSLEADRFDATEFAKIDSVLHEKTAARLKEAIMSSPEWGQLMGKTSGTEHDVEVDATVGDDGYADDSGIAPVQVEQPVQQPRQAVAARTSALTNSAIARSPMAQVQPARAAVPAATQRASVAQAQPARQPARQAAPAPATARTVAPAPARPATAPGSVSARAAPVQQAVRGRMAPRPAVSDVEDEIPY